jgi:excisionase family DNA binding protein
LITALAGRAKDRDNLPMPVDTTTSRLGLSTSQVARQLGVSLGTVRRWADMGHLRAYRTPGGQRRFSVEQVEEFLTSLEQENPQTERRFTPSRPR